MKKYEAQKRYYVKSKKNGMCSYCVRGSNALITYVKLLVKEYRIQDKNKQ